jgi:hypothetical protein
MRGHAGAFFQNFRREVYERLEYSFGEDPSELGTMTGGEGAFVDRAVAFAEALPYARDWSQQMVRYATASRPIAYLLRASWQGDKVVSITLYCRLRPGTTRDQFDAALAAAGCGDWEGPEPWDIGKILQTDGPTGIAFRVDAAGRLHQALYYRVETVAAEFFARALRPLVERLGLGAESLRMIEHDFPRLHRAPITGVIGIDGSAQPALKIDPAGVPMALALDFFRRRGAAEARLRQLSRMTRNLGASQASYVGMKYGTHGFLGWKLYLSIMPCAAPLALAPVVDANQPTIFIGSLRRRAVAA